MSTRVITLDVRPRAFHFVSTILAIALLAIGTAGILRGPILDSPLATVGLVLAIVVSAALAQIAELRIAALPVLGIASGIAAVNSDLPRGPGWFAFAGLAIIALRIAADRRSSLPAARQVSGETP